MKLIDDFFKIRECKDVDGGFACTVELNPQHFIYAAHFPQNPITPGVCMMQMAGEILERRLGCSLELVRVNNIKYMAVISPAENPVVDYRFSQPSVDEGQCRVKVAVENGTQAFARMSLTYDVYGAGDR